MSDSPFQRPGSVPRPATRAWQDTPSGGEWHTAPIVAAPARPIVPEVRRRRERRLWLASGVAGCVLGGVAVGVLSSLYFADPEPVTISTETFPEFILGFKRLDAKARDAGDGDTVARMVADLESQVGDFRFAYGGDGAALDYEGSLTLTIVNGRLSPGLPSENRGEFGANSPRLVSLVSGGVSCVFEPMVGLYDGAVLHVPPDLSASGLTDCVLVDEERNLSLRLVNHTDTFPTNAIETARSFAGVLERTLADLVD